jgi:hypothetical protein
MNTALLCRAGLRGLLALGLILVLHGVASAQQPKKTLRPKTTPTTTTPTTGPRSTTDVIRSTPLVPINPIGTPLQPGQPFPMLNGKGQPMFAGVQGALMNYTGGIYGPMGPFASMPGYGPGYGYGPPPYMYGYPQGYATTYGGFPMSASPGMWSGNPYMPGAWSGFPSPYGY